MKIWSDFWLSCTVPIQITQEYLKLKMRRIRLIIQWEIKSNANIANRCVHITQNQQSCLIFRIFFLWQFVLTALMTSLNYIQRVYGVIKEMFSYIYQFIHFSITIKSTIFFEILLGLCFSQKLKPVQVCIAWISSCFFFSLVFSF